MEKHSLLTGSPDTCCKKPDCFCGECSEDSSSSSSYYSDSDSSVPEWESSITSTGELLYIDCDPTVSDNSNQQEVASTDFIAKTSVRKSTRNKFLRLLHGRDSKRRSKHSSKTQEPHTNLQDSVRVKFQDHDEGEIREVLLKTNRHDNRQLGRRATLIESVLGISVSTLLDGSRIMIAGFIPDSEAAKLSNIKIGDWLRSINNIDINFQNINSVLAKISLGTDVLLKLQRVAGIEVTKNPPISELSNQSQFVQKLLNRQVDESLNNWLCKHQVGVLYLSTENLNEDGLDDQGVTYRYPEPCATNLLYNLKGVFITLNHLLNNITRFNPNTTSGIFNGQMVHIAYERFTTDILFLLLPDNNASCNETKIILKEIVNVIKFTYQSIDKCFETLSFKDSLDKLFSSIFTQILCGDANYNQANNELGLEQTKWKFEHVLPVTKFLTLHEDAQLQIEVSLNELEASDYREWNEEPLDCQRLFTILGSALFHDGYLLASHLVHEDLIDIYLFSQYHGLFYLSQTEPLRSIILWKEVYPISCNRNIDSGNSLFVAPNGKRYLLIVGKGKDLLTVLMEAGGSTEPPEENLSPDAFYVEEAQATLEHLLDLGIADIAEHFIKNPSWQIVTPEIPLKRKSDFLGNIPFAKSTSPSIPNSISALPKHKPEVTSILKHRSPDRTRFPSSFSLHDDVSEIHSEDSLSQSSFSETSEEPVIGRRAAREKKNLESDEESDIDDCRNSSSDLSDLKQSLLAETADLKPTHLTAGVENVLFYYVSLDMTEGVLICPPKLQVTTSVLDTVVKSFRMCAHQIHNTFENTLRLKNMLAQDMSKFVTNKSLVAIKEQGMLFECGCTSDEATKKFGKLTYWVVGRLFYTPHPREVYICYQDSVPQNIIEIAFKLGVTSG